MSLLQVDLDDKYRTDAGRIYLSGVQALVRLPILQRQRDRAQNRNTAGFISGYRGSPLGTYDSALWRAKSFLQKNDIAFVPGLNEDLAATAVWGSQQVGLFPGGKVDGVFGIWYGKGPGVDRSTDALKHANSAGTSPHGGVLAFAGDDHGCQSSTLAHQSEQIFAAAMMPILNPATLQDYLDLGILGFALSRFSGCWVGFKAISETVESSASISSGKVEMWRGGCRLNISVSAPFVWRCLSGSTLTPFPHPAHRTGHADFPHPALGQDFTHLLLRATPSAVSELSELIGGPISMSFTT